MKKLLLSLTVLLATIGASAYEIGDYIFTTNAKFKVIGENAVPALAQWTGSDDADTWSTPSEPEYANSLESLDGSEGAPILTTSTPLTFGSYYVVTLKIKGVADGNSSITAGAQNEINAFITNAEPSANGVLTGTANADYFMVASSQSILNGEWAEISFSLVDTCTEATIGADPHYLNITIGRLTTGTVIAEAEVREVTQVYDTRVMDRKIDFAQQIMADANFNVGADPSELEETIETYQAMLEAGEADDQATMESLANMISEALKVYMDFSSEDLSASFTNIGITGFAKYNRGNISNEQVIGNFKFRGDNWLHSSGSEVLNKQIQGTYTNNAGSLSLYNENLTAGKYYIAGELMNAYCDKNYNYTYTLEKQVKLYVGSDSSDVHLISGKDFVKFYYVGELKEGETFDAGFWWEGHGSGTTFQVKNLEVRGFGDISAKLARQTAWNSFLTQWNAATSARNAVLAKQGNASYPWDQDSIANALAEWDPYYNAIYGVWIDADGKDLGAATNEQLTAFGDGSDQGYTPTEEEVEANSWKTKYTLVRAYQYVNNYLQAQNQPYIDLVALVAEAKAAVANPNFASLDSDDLSAAIESAETLIAGVTATKQTDEFTAEIATLQEALDAFYANGASFYEQAEITIINGDFKYKSENLTGGESATDSSKGWNSYTTNTSEYWRLGDGGKDANGEYIYESQNRAAMWRGWTGNPAGSLTQDVTVTKAGHYNFKCQAYVTGDDARIITSVRHINIVTDEVEVWNEEIEDYSTDIIEISRDTTYLSGIKLVFGSVTNNAIDSLDIWTSGETVGNYTPQWFIMGYDKETEGEEVLRFGMDGLLVRDYMTNGLYNGSYSPNAYGFGSVHVLYGGPSDKYYADEAEYIATGVEAVAAATSEAKPVAIYTLSGAQVKSYIKGINIVKYSDGSVKKILIK